MNIFSITKIASDPSGESYFEDVSIPLESAGAIGYLSEKYEAETIIFRKVLPSYDYDFHTAPAKQYIILLDGEIEIEISTGEKRIFRAGEVIMVEDTTGKGHRTRNLKDEERNSIFVTYR